MKNRKAAFIWILLCLTLTLSADNDKKAQPVVHFNQSLIEESATDGIMTDSWEAVLSLVVNAMDENITVYPSEGYYYFSFFNNGELIKGNLRFDVEKRDEGKLLFAYYNESTHSEENAFFAELNETNGVSLKRIDTFQYELQLKNVTKQVHIYSAEKERKTPLSLPSSEEWVGPLVDDSGVRFHLIYDHIANVFLFVLNENIGYSETFVSLDYDDNIRKGLRTGFVYFNDKKYKRMVLIGVSLQSVRRNDHYDGPFDQLPDSFVDGVHLKELIETYNPQMKGLLRAYGIYKNDSSSRYAISPYIEYTDEKELFVVYQCLSAKERSDLNFCLGKKML